jgi:hypothetical protein
MSQIATEVGLSLPVSINHPRLLALANKSGFPISFTDFLGKTGRFDGSLPTQVAGGLFVSFSNAPFLGGQLQLAQYVVSTGETEIFFNSLPPVWRGNILLRNNTTGVQSVLTFNASAPGFWQNLSSPANLMRNGATDNYTVLPSN